MGNVYLTVGPSQLYPTVKSHIKKALEEDITSILHRGGKFTTIYQETTNNLRKLLNIPKSSRIFFISSGSEGMERIIQNLVLKNSFHLITGAFSTKFYQMAIDYKKKAQKSEITNLKSFNLNNLKIPKQIELICLTQNETSTGVAIPMDDIHKLKDRYSDKLIAIDVVSSVPYADIKYKKIDAVFFSVQKGFGLPAGLGVLIVNEKAIKKARWISGKVEDPERSRRGESIGGYHSFLSLLEEEKNFQTPETPNVLNIYLLGKVLEDMLKVGIKKIRKETEEKAELIYKFFDSHKNLKPAVGEEKYRSKTTFVLNTKGKTKEILEKLNKKSIVINSGYGDNKDTQLRFANFPSHKKEDFKKMFACLN